MTSIRFLVMIIASILLAEIVVVSYLSILRPLSIIKEVLLSTSLITLIICPILYYILLRPIRSFKAEQKRIKDKLQSLSLTDELTGLYSRRGFFDLANRQLKLAKRQKMKAFLLYANMNNLKEINDTFGRKEGEKALIDIANILRRTYRESDIIARLNGVEFAVYPVGITDTDVNPKILADRFQINLALHNAEYYQLSVSVDISSIDTEFTCSIDEVLS
jgi:diguanylate cyclase (GGDEF)-like protein